MPQNRIINNIKGLFAKREEPDDTLVDLLKVGGVDKKATPITWAEMRKMTEQGKELLESQTHWTANEIPSAYVCGNEEEGFLALITNKAAYSYLYTKKPGELSAFLKDPDSMSGRSIVFGTTEFCRPSKVFSAFEGDARKVIVENAKLCSGINASFSETHRGAGTRDMRYTLEMVSEAARTVAANYQKCLHENELGRQIVREKYPELKGKKPIGRDRMQESIQFMKEQERKAENKKRMQKAKAAR